MASNPKNAFSKSCSEFNSEIEKRKCEEKNVLDTEPYNAHVLEFAYDHDGCYQILDLGL